MPRAPKADDGHPRRDRGLRAGRRILDRKARRGVDAQPLGGGEVDVGKRLAAIPAVGAIDMRAEMMREAEQPERPADIFSAARRGDRARRGAERTEIIGAARAGSAAPPINRPPPRPVRLAERYARRAPRARPAPQKERSGDEG